MSTARSPSRSNCTEPAAAEDGVVRTGLQRELLFGLVADDRDRP
jgi:hypothetical protein